MDYAVIETFFTACGDSYDVIYRKKNKDYFFVYMYSDDLNAMGLPFDSKNEAIQFAISFVQVWNMNFFERYK